MVDRQKELYHQQLAAQAAWLRSSGYTQHSGFPSGGSHANPSVNPYENLMRASNLLGNAANKDMARFPSPFGFPGQFPQFGYQRPLAAHSSLSSANMKASSSNPLAAHMMSNPYQYPANYYGMNPNYLHGGESGSSGVAAAAGSGAALAAMNNYVNRSSAASSSDRFRQQFDTNSLERDSSRRGRGGQSSGVAGSSSSSSLNGGSGMTPEANAAFNLQQLQAAYNQAAALNSNASHSSSGADSGSSNKSSRPSSSSYPSYFPGSAQSSSQPGQGFGSSNTSVSDINDHIAKEVMKTFGDSLTPQLLRQMQLSSMQQEAAAASHKSTPDHLKESRKPSAYPPVSAVAAMNQSAGGNNQNRYSNQYRQPDMKSGYGGHPQHQQHHQHQLQQEQAMRASAMAAAAAARGHAGSLASDPTAGINSFMEYLGGASGSSYAPQANKNTNQRSGGSSNSSSLQDYQNPLPQQYGNPREMVDNYFKSHASMGQSSSPSMGSVTQRQPQQQSSVQQRDLTPQNLMSENQRLDNSVSKHNQNLDNNGYQHHQSLLQQQQQHNMTQQQMELQKQSQRNKLMSQNEAGHAQAPQHSPMHSFQQNVSPRNCHTSPGQAQSSSQPSPAAHISPMGPSPSHPGPSPSQTGPSPTHPGPSPSHPGPSPHPAPSPSQPLHSPSHTETHPGPSPSQPGPSPTHMGPSPSHTGPSMSHSGPSPSQPGPSPFSPVENVTSPAHISPSAGQYSPNNVDPKMSPYSQAASPYSQVSTNKMSPYSQPSPHMSPYSQPSPRMSPYSGMSPYSQHSPQMPSYSQPSPQMLPSYSQTSPKVNNYSSVSPVYHGNHLGAPQTSPSYHPRPPSPINTLPIIEPKTTESVSKSSLDLRASPEPLASAKPIINEISLSKKCSNDSPRLDTPPGIALPPQQIEEEKTVQEDKSLNFKADDKPLSPEIAEEPIKEDKKEDSVPQPETVQKTTATPTTVTTTLTMSTTSTTTTTTTATTTTTTSTTSSSTPLSNSISNISSMTNKIKLLESKMQSAKNKTSSDRSTIEDNSLKKWWKPQQIVKEAVKPSPSKPILSPGLPDNDVDSDFTSTKLTSDNQKENSISLINTDNEESSKKDEDFSIFKIEQDINRERSMLKTERKHFKKSLQKEAEKSQELSQASTSYSLESPDDLDLSPVSKKKCAYSPEKKSSKSPVSNDKESLVNKKSCSPPPPVNRKSSLHSPVKKRPQSSPAPYSSSKKSSNSPVVNKPSTVTSKAIKSISQLIASSKASAANKSRPKSPVVSKASLKESVFRSKSKDKLDYNSKNNSSERVKERRSSSRYDFDAKSEETTAKEIKHGKFKSKPGANSSNNNGSNSHGRANSPAPNLDRMEVRNSGIPGPGAVTWKRKSVDDSPGSLAGNGSAGSQLHKNKRRKVERPQQDYNQPQSDSSKMDSFGDFDDVYQFDEKDARLSPKKDPKNRSSKYPVYKYKRDLMNRDADAHTPPPVPAASPPPPQSTPKSEPLLPPSNHKVLSKHQQNKQPLKSEAKVEKSEVTTDEDLLRQSLIDSKLGLHGADKYMKKKNKRPRQEQWSLQDDEYKSNSTSKPSKKYDSKEKEDEKMDIDTEDVKEEIKEPAIVKNKKLSRDPFYDDDNQISSDDIKKEAKVSVDKWYQAFGASSSNASNANVPPTCIDKEKETYKPEKKEVKRKEEKPVNDDEYISDDINDINLDIKPDTSFLEIPPEVRRKTRPNFGGLKHFSSDWNRQVRRHHDRCRLPKQLDSSSNLSPKALAGAGEATLRKSYEDYARKDMVSPPHLQTLERERLEAKAYTSVSSTDDSEIKGELPSIVETILMNRKKLRQSMKMGRMYQIPFMKEKKMRMRMRKAASQASAADSNLGLFLTPGLPLLTEDTKEVLLGGNQTSSATSFGNFRPYTLNKYLDYGGEVDKPKYFMYGEPEVFDSKTRSKANEKVFGPTITEIFGRDIPSKSTDKKLSSAKKDVKKPKKSDVKASTSSEPPSRAPTPPVPGKASLELLERLKGKASSTPKSLPQDDLFAFSQEVGEPTEEENNLQSELGSFALDLLETNPSWQNQVTIQNLVVWEPIEPLPLSVKKKRPKKKRSRKSGLDFTPSAKRKLAHRVGGSCDASRASSPLGGEEENEVHEITYTLDQVVQESMRWVVDKRAGETILQRAAKQGYPDVIAYALGMQGLTVKEKDFAGFVPLDKAALKGHHEAVRTLLRFGADPSSGIKGTKAIHDAVESGSLETVYLLLGFGADPLHHNYSGSMPIDLANMTGDKRMQHYLTNLLADLHGKPPPPARGAFAALAAPQSVIRWNVSDHPEFHQPEKDAKFMAMSSRDQTDTSAKTASDDESDNESLPTDLEDLMFEVSAHPLPTEFKLQDRDGDFVMYRELKDFAKKFGHHKSDIREKCYIIELKKSEFLRTARCKAIDRKINLEVKFHEREDEDSIILVRVDKFVRKIYNSDRVAIPR